MKAFSSLIVLFLAASILFPTPTLAKVVRSGVPTIVARFGSWNYYCQQAGFVTISKLSVDHGTVQIRKRVPVKIGGKVARGSAYGCVGKTVKGVAIVYTSNRGYRGKDKVRFRVTFERKWNDIVLDVNVK
ncbi:hypothetical protein GGD81_000557 [Rhodobium orientis]|uniref:Uncharacterized protein n=1 Tax=Rhodobium orientis TaxID=34017 RepID=A0A327JJ41_9HYPH|nr:hypothetical protein [Rhodobium orientis]MBB4301540.1 hypothetical protein [Rhodobium orientis]MBK5952237.1 hypothetical protein [Rhodobium orientis]RAI24822.1 hypothetical protein CH339_21040 [Rhodobium orientis]